jgi:hypothetical protein
LLLIVQSFGASHTALSAGLYTLAAGLVLMYLGAFYLVKIMQRTAT